MSPPVSSLSQLQSSSSSAHIYQTAPSNHQFYHQQTISTKKEATSSISFWDSYEHLCALQNLMPIQSLKASLAAEGGTVLNLNADKLRLTLTLL